MFLPLHHKLVRGLLLTLFLSGLAQANFASVVSEGLISHADTLALANHAVWHELLAYESSGLLLKHTEGKISSPVFYLSPEGNSDAYAELVATLEAFYSESSKNSEDSALCRYPGRFIWLDQQIDLGSHGLALSHCHDYFAWLDQNNVGSISLLFVTGYLGNPASYYGHNMLKLNPRSSTDTNLEDITVSFGASIPADAGFVSYLINGMTGGYSGVFSRTEFFHYANNYGESEFRDIWEYELALNDSDLSLMLAHLYELLQQDYAYYFFNKNCAYRIGRLFSVLQGRDLTSGNPFWYAPHTLVQRLFDEDNTGNDLSSNIRYRPSRQSRLYQGFNDLNSMERDLVENAITSTENLGKPAFTSASLTTQHRVLDVLLDYFQFLDKSDSEQNTSNAQSYREILRTRYTLPAGTAKFAEALPKGPHDDRPVSYSAVSFASNENLGAVARITFRPAYYDQLDYGDHHAPVSALSMGEVEFLAHNGDFYVSRLRLVKVESNTALVTGLPGDTGKSWMLELGARQASQDDPSSLVANVTGEMGQALALNNTSLIIGWRLGGTVQQSYNGSGPISANATLFMGSSITEKLRTHLTLGYRDYMESSHMDDQALGFAMRYQLSNKSDIRLFYNTEQTSEYGIQLGYYW